MLQVFVDTNSSKTNYFTRPLYAHSLHCAVNEADSVFFCTQQAVYGNGQEGNFGGASMLPGAAGGLFQYSSPLPHPQAPIQPPSTPPIGKHTHIILW
jgi:hypothetical protein